MKVLIAMAIYNPEDSGRMEVTKVCLEQLMRVTDFRPGRGNRLYLIDNCSHHDTRNWLHSFMARVSQLDVVLILNPENVGTAKAVNQGWANRMIGEACVKMDNDCVIYTDGWVNQLTYAIQRDPSIGICGLKRKDLLESPSQTNEFYKSKLTMLPHEPGEHWIVAEEVNHVIGTCQMYSSELLNKFGYLWQPRLYGFDDVLASVRSKLLGFRNVFLPHIDIDHIDPSGRRVEDMEYTKWKHKHSSEDMAEHEKIIYAYENGLRPLYEQP